MNELKSEVLIDELRVASRVYTDIRIGEPVRGRDGIARVPLFDGQGFLWKLIELREDLSPLHFVAIQTTPDRTVWAPLMARLIGRGHAVETPYSYRSGEAREPIPVLLASGELKRFLEDPTGSSAIPRTEL